MRDRVLNWVLYTVLIGSVPIIVRIFVYCTDSKAELSFILNSSDLATLGLASHITTIADLETAKDLPPRWKKINTVLAVVFIICYGALLSSVFRSELKNNTVSAHGVTFLSLVLVLASILMGLAVQDRLADLEEKRVT